jgi:hypothetical protein
MSKFVSFILGGYLIIFLGGACKQRAVRCSISKDSINHEIDKWKSELRINGVVGPPCKEQYDEWIEENPNYYYGMQPIRSLSSDLNEDGKEEVLCFFPALTCVGGNGTDSDFAMLLFHKDSMLLSNKSIVLQIEEFIKGAVYSNFRGDKAVEIADVNVFFDAMSETISGHYVLWIYEDAHCCPSFEGTFNYRPFELSIEIMDKKMGSMKIDVAKLRGF